MLWRRHLNASIRGRLVDAKTFTEPEVIANRMPITLPLRVRDLVFEINGVRVLDGVNLDIPAAGCTAVLGYNGAGKSVLMRLLHGLLVPTSGEIQWSGSFDAEQIAQRQSMVFQTPVLLRRSVEANIRYALTKRGFKGDERGSQIEDALEQTNLLNLRHRHARVLSGGERQRVAIARALAVKPEVVFLDEPTASLDPAATIAIESILHRASSNGCKLIAVTQSVGQALRLANDIVFMHHGKVVEHTPRDEFLETPRSDVARAFVDGKLYE